MNMLAKPPYELHIGDCLTSLKTMADQSVNCCVTSPPYFGLRNYGVAGQMGLEATPDEFVNALVTVLREVRRVLSDDGTLWLNLGDSYGKAKQLLGIPWRVAFALQTDGWYLRQDIIWNKPNPMPESVKDRCTKAHEYIFLLSKSSNYFFDSAAIREPNAPGTLARLKSGPVQSFAAGPKKAKSRNDGNDQPYSIAEGRNRRSVWLVAPAPFKGAHFATFPPALIEPCILAGCPVGGTVLDPFGGSGTTAGVALAHGRKAVLCELNPEYAELMPSRVSAIIMATHGDLV